MDTGSLGEQLWLWKKWRQGLGAVGMKINQQLCARFSVAHLNKDVTFDAFSKELL